VNLARNALDDERLLEKISRAGVRQLCQAVMEMDEQLRRHGPNGGGFAAIGHNLVTLRKYAGKVRDAFHYDPGHSDLDREQPITIHTTLGAWRDLNYALNATSSPTSDPQNGDKDAG
jgi:hypothetical protein